MVTRIELRVHAAAPSSRKDDDRAKVQAEAYAAFQPATRTVLLQAPEPIHTKVTSTSHDQGDFSAADEPNGDLQRSMGVTQLAKGQDETTVLEWDPTIFLDETQLGFTALESQLITSSLRVSKTPYKHPVGTIEGRAEDRTEAALTIAAPFSVSKRKPLPPVATESSRVGSIEPERRSKRPRLAEQLDPSPREPASIRDASSASAPTPGSGERASIPKLEPEHASSSDQPPSQSSYLLSPELGRRKDRARPSYDAYMRNKAQRVLLPTFQTIQENGRPAAALVGNRSPGQGENLNLGQSQVRSHSASADDITSELPTSYSLSDITSGSSRSKQHSSLNRSVSDPGPASHVSEVPPATARPASPELDQVLVGVTPEDLDQAKRQNVSPVVVKDFATPAHPPASPSKQAPSATASTSGSPEDALPTEIRPPLPEVSTRSFETHVTAALDHLASHEALANAYKPVFATRDLNKTERGHWSFDMTPWPDQLRREFFDFLANTVGQGKAGWGVWCARGTDESGPHLVKVFCWGEVVRHVYLMLYVASKSKVRKLGLRWIDAEGKVVVQMRSTADAA